MAAEREPRITVEYDTSASSGVLDNAVSRIQDVLALPQEYHSDKIEVLEACIDKQNSELVSAHIAGSEVIVYGGGLVERPSGPPIPTSHDLYGIYKGLIHGKPTSRARQTNPPQVFHAITVAYSIEPLSFEASLRGEARKTSSKTHASKTVLVPLNKTSQIDILNSPESKYTDQEGASWIQTIDQQLGRIQENRLMSVQRAARIFDLAATNKRPGKDPTHQHEIDIALDRMERYFAISGKIVELYAEEAAAMQKGKANVLPRNIHPFKGVLLGFFDMDNYESIFPKKNDRHNPGQPTDKTAVDLPPILGIALETTQNGTTRLLHIPARACTRLALAYKQ